MAQPCSQYDAFAPDAPREAVQLAKQLALQAGPSGITVDNLTVKLEQSGATVWAAHWLGSVMRQAGLIPTGRRIRSELPGKHGNLRQIWVAKEYA